MPNSLKSAAPFVETVDTSYLETLIGYNARRAALAVIGQFLERMAVYDLKPVDFSVMSVVVHNPGVTSRQLCAALNILPPNLVGLVQSLESRGLIERLPHPHDGRAMGLHPTEKGLEPDCARNVLLHSSTPNVPILGDWHLNIYSLQRL